MKASPQFRRGTIYIRIDHKGKQALYKTEFSIDKSEWRSKPDRYGHRVHRHPLSGKINARLDQYRIGCERIWKLMGYSEPVQLKAHLDRVGLTDNSITEGTTIDFIQSQQISRSEMNQASHQTLITHLKHFDPAIGIDQWTRDKLDEFQRFLWSRKRINSQNTVWGRMRDLRTNLNLAMQKDLITPMQNPFSRGYKVAKGGSKDHKLLQEEITRLWEYVEESRAVQVWFLAFLLDGSRFSEIIQLRHEHIVGKRIEFEVSKKGHQRIIKSIPVTKKIQYVIDLTNKEYQGDLLVGFFNKSPYKKDSPRYFNGSWNAVLNEELKVYARKAGVRTRISMHVARNTFAYMADKMGYSIVEIQDALKHSNVQVTRNYIGRLQTERLDGKRKGLHDLF